MNSEQVEQEVRIICEQVLRETGTNQSPHRYLQSEITKLAQKFGFIGDKEYLLPGFRGDRDGRLDVVWAHNKLPVVAFEIDSRFRRKSIQKLLTIGANLQFWVYFGIEEREWDVRQIDQGEKIRIIHLRKASDQLPKTTPHPFKLEETEKTEIVTTSNRDMVLVAIINNKLDFNIAYKQHWYRIPVSSVKNLLKDRWPPQWLAFYQTKAFEMEAYSIHYYTKVLNIREVRRHQLFPDEPHNSKSNKQYFQLFLDSLQRLPKPIFNHRLRRIVFIPTTGKKFFNASELDDLYDQHLSTSGE